MNYHPDKWIIIKKGDDFRVLATWSGSYTYGASWRINSGITEVREERTSLYFYGESGSSYCCSKNSYGVASAYNHSIVQQVRRLNWYELDYAEAMAFVKEKLNEGVPLSGEG